MGGAPWDSAVGGALWISGIVQWIEHYGIGDSSGDRAVWDSGMAQWMEHCGIVR